MKRNYWPKKIQELTEQEKIDKNKGLMVCEFWAEWNEKNCISFIDEIDDCSILRVNVDNNVTHQKEMKWAWAKMVDIPVEEQENYPDPNGGFYTKKIDIDNRILLSSFLEGMVYINDKSKEPDEKPKSVGLKLPKLKKK